MNLNKALGGFVCLVALVAGIDAVFGSLWSPGDVIPFMHWFLAAAFVVATWHTHTHSAGSHQFWFTAAFAMAHLHCAFANMEGFWNMGDAWGAVGAAVSVAVLAIAGCHMWEGGDD